MKTLWLHTAAMLLTAVSGTAELTGQVAREAEGTKPAFGAGQDELFRCFMLAGGKPDMQLKDGTASSFDIRIPVPRDVFHSYLQCSGDLYAATG